MTREKPSAQAYDIKSLSHYVFSKTASLSQEKQESSILGFENLALHEDVFVSSLREKESWFRLFKISFRKKQDSEVRDLIFCHISEQAKVSYLVLVDGYQYELVENERNYFAESSNENLQSRIIAEVPGKIVKVLIAKDEQLLPEQLCFVLESMKMEFEVRSLKSAKVSSVNVKVGQQVEAGTVLVDFCEE